MPYAVVWSLEAEEDLSRLEKEISHRIVSKVLAASFTPYHFAERLVDSEAFRIRVGDYRILVDISEKTKEIQVLHVGHRKGIYKP